MAGCRSGDILAGRVVRGLSLAALLLAAAPALALPPDPQRPLEAVDCAAAQARLAEARAGSPLISAGEAADLLVRAEAQARRLCDGEAPGSEKTKNGLKVMRQSLASREFVLCRQ